MKVKLIGGLFLVATAMLAQAPNAGKSADQLRDLASHAKDFGDLQSEANYLCQAAALDGKKYGKKCDRAKDDVAKALAQFQADLEMGRSELQHRDYPGALRDLGKIAFGPNKLEAQELIQQARVGANGGMIVDPASLAALKAAREAYLHGDFDLAESQAKHVQSPSLQAAANELLRNISVLREVQTTAEVSTTAANPQAQSAIPEQTVTQGKATQPQSKVTHAIKAKNSLDTTRREKTQGDLKNIPEPGNTSPGPNTQQAEVVAGNKHAPEGTQDDSKMMEESLAGGVADFYASHFSHADDAIGVYLQGGGNRYAGAAHFYLGASLLTQALLTSPKDQPKSDALRQKAQNQFVLAKQLHYRPIESAVSPKILAHWAEVGEQ
jgi:hypothetical protein